MIDRSNEIYSKVREHVKDLCPNATQTIDDGNTKFPMIAIMVINSSDVSERLNNYGDTAVTCHVEIRVFTKGSGKLQAGKKIINLACDKMKSMGFRTSYGPIKFDNASDTEVNQMISRHTRVIGAGDVLEWS